MFDILSAALLSNLLAPTPDAGPKGQTPVCRIVLAAALLAIVLIVACA